MDKFGRRESCWEQDYVGSRAGRATSITTCPLGFPLASHLASVRTRRRWERFQGRWDVCSLTDHKLTLNKHNTSNHMVTNKTGQKKGKIFNPLKPHFRLIIHLRDVFCPSSTSLIDGNGFQIERLNVATNRDLSRL